MKSDESMAKMNKDSRAIIRVLSALMVVAIIMFTNGILMQTRIITTPLTLDGIFAIFLVSLIVSLALYKPVVSLQNWLMFTLPLRPKALADEFAEALTDLKRNIKVLDEDLESYKHSSQDFVLASRRRIEAIDINHLKSIIQKLRQRKLSELPMPRGYEYEYFMSRLMDHRETIISIYNDLDAIRGDRMQTFATLAAIQVTIRYIDSDEIILRDQTARSYEQFLQVYSKDSEIIQRNMDPEAADNLDWTRARQRMENHAGQLMQILNAKELAPVRNSITTKMQEISDRVAETHRISPLKETSPNREAYLSMKESKRYLQKVNSENKNDILLLADAIHSESWCDAAIKYDLEDLDKPAQKHPA